MSSEKLTFIGHIVPRLNDNDGRKLVRRMRRDMTEFKGYLQDAHAAILEHTPPEYFDRQKTLFAATVQAIEHLEAVLQCAEGGIVLCPEGWQVAPKADEP